MQKATAKDMPTTRSKHTACQLQAEGTMNQKANRERLHVAMHLSKFHTLANAHVQLQCAHAAQLLPQWSILSQV
jgi:hypothetical protein